MSPKELTNRVKQEIRSIDPMARIILFGSRARRNGDINSDWDFLVLTSLTVNEFLKKKIRERLIDTELEAEEVISTLIFSQSRWDDYQITPLYKNISRDGVEI